jgi:hypothetical protein
MVSSGSALAGSASARAAIRHIATSNATTASHPAGIRIKTILMLELTKRVLHERGLLPYSDGTLGA